MYVQPMAQHLTLDASLFMVSDTGKVRSPMPILFFIIKLSQLVVQ
jgi:stress response protein SCP2